MGAAGVMVAPASTLRTDDQIIAYFDMVAETLGAGCPGCCRTTQCRPACRCRRR